MSVTLTIDIFPSTPNCRTDVLKNVAQVFRSMGARLVDRESDGEITTEITVDEILAGESSPDFAFAVFGYLDMELLVSFRSDEKSDSLDNISISVISSRFRGVAALENVAQLVSIMVRLHKEVTAVRSLADLGLEDGLKEYFWQDELKRLREHRVEGCYWLDIVSDSYVSDSYVESRSNCSDSPVTAKRFSWGYFWRSALLP